MDYSNESMRFRETAFEKKRGVSKVELGVGFAQVHVADLPEPIHTGRLVALQCVKECEIGIFFLKMTSTGLSFLVKEEVVERLSERFAKEFTNFTVDKGRSVVFVHAVNLRDEEGLLANILSEAISTGARLEHIGDLHDSVCISASHEDAQKIAKAIEGKEFVTL